MHGINTDPFLDTDHTAKYIGVSVRTIEDWRQKGRGPAFVKLGRLVRYRLSDLDLWLHKHTVTGDAA